MLHFIQKSRMRDYSKIAFVDADADIKLADKTFLCSFPLSQSGQELPLRQVWYFPFHFSTGIYHSRDGRDWRLI